MQNGVTLSGGTLATSGTGAFQAISSGSNFLDNVTLNGTLDMTTVANSREQIINGATINGVVNIANGGILGLNSANTAGGNQTIGGTGVINLNDAGAHLSIDGNGSTTLASGITVRGQGNIGTATFVGGSNALINNGTILADGGTLTIAAPANSGTLSGTGTLQTSGGTLNLTGSANTQGKLVMGGAGSALNLNNHNLTITNDYTNAQWGNGNSFNRLAGVTTGGTNGKILAGGDVAQTITGANVTNGTTANATMTIGNVHVGANNFNYQIANTGTTGPSLRGAIQTTANGANLTDARLSGTGVTASNYNTGAPGSNTGDLGVTFTAATAGALAPLSGQKLNLTSNFDNIADQKLNIVLGSGAAAFNLAVGNATPSPVTIANQRIGGTKSQALTVSNTAPSGSFTERLDAGFGTNTGSATNNGGTIGLLSGGANNNSAMSVGVNTASAGHNTGTVTLNYTSNGSGTSGLGTTNVGSQIIDVGGNVYQAAIGNATPTPVQVANQRIGGGNTAALTIANTATGANGFVEDLNASVGSVSGDASGSGGITGRLAGTNNTGTGAITVGVDTLSAGAKTGMVTLNYQTAGAVNGINNSLGTASAGSQGVTVNGNVYQAATGAIQTAALNFGTVQVGQSVSQNLVIRNTATGPSGFVEDLNASFGSASGTGAGLISGSGSLSGILAGQDSNLGSGLMTVSVNTLSAGVVAGSIGVNYFTAGAVNGVSNGLGLASAGSENYGVNGTIQTVANVINQASPLVNNPSINFGAMRVGDLAPTANVSVTNQATTAPQAALNASISSNGAPVTASGSFNLLAPGDTSPDQLQVGLNTGTAGNFTGANAGHATIALVSDASNVGGCGLNCQMTLASQDVTVSGKVYQKAVAQVNTNSVDFGIVHVGDNVTKNVSVTNSAPSAALNDVLTGSLGSATDSHFTTGGNLGGGLAAGTTSSNNSLTAILNAGSTAGVFTGNATASFQSHNGDMADLILADATIGLTAQVNNYAKPEFNKVSGSGSWSGSGSSYSLNLGHILQNLAVDSSLQLLNNVSGFADTVLGSFTLPTDPNLTLSGFGSPVSLAPEAFNNLFLAFESSTLGTFTDIITLHWQGSNANYLGDLADINLFITGDVVGQQAVPEPSTLLLAGIGLTGIGLLRRKNRS